MQLPKQHCEVTVHVPPIGVHCVPPSGGDWQMPPTQPPVQQSLSALQVPPADWHAFAHEKPVGELGSGRH